jgi:hypothetical protein
MFTLQPSLAQRFFGGRLELAGSFQFGYYMDDQGYDLTLALKLACAVTNRLKLWLSATGQVESDQAGNDTLLGFLAAGVRVKF